MQQETFAPILYFIRYDDFATALKIHNGVPQGLASAILTNDVLKATTHRVVNPDDSGRERFSMPYFVHPNVEATLKCVPSCKGEQEKYQPINSMDFLLKRLEEIGLGDYNNR